MIIPKKKRRPLLELLLHRWTILAPFAAAQKLHVLTKQQNLPIVGNLFAQLVAETKPELQIEIIKNKIIEILPEANFIAPAFESPSGELVPDDFIEVCIGHQEICILKVRELMQRMKIK